MVDRSKCIKSVKPRGGVAVYKNVYSKIEIKSMKLNLMDCVMVEIINSNIVVIAMYIPP